MTWRIKHYKNLSVDERYGLEELDVKKLFYIWCRWDKHTTSICPLNIKNFYNVVVKKDMDW